MLPPIPIRRKNITAVVNIGVFVLLVTVNALAVLLPINGKSTSQLAEEYPNLFTPAGITFSIWSVIYALLAGFIVLQAITLLKKSHPAQEKILSISPLFIVNGLANAGWILAWHHELIVVSVIIMVVILVTLIAIHERLNLALPVNPLAEKLWLDLPFSVYLGWITIATIANVTALLVHFQWEAWQLPPDVWTMIMIVCGLLLTGFMINIKNNLAFGLVVIWAFYGIILKRRHFDEMMHRNIILCAEICIATIAFILIVQLIRSWKTDSPEQLPSN